MSARRRLALAVLIAAWPGLAVASAPDQSPRPPAAPGRSQPELLVPASAVLPGPSAPLGFAGKRPRPRPDSAIPAAVAPSAALAFDGPRPRARPEELVPQPAERASVAAGIRAAGAGMAAFPTAQDPASRPSAAATIAFAASPRPAGRPATTESATPASFPPLRSVQRGPGGFVCGVPTLKGEPIPDITERVKGCGLEDGVRVTSVAGIGLSMPIETDCATARTLDGWVERAVKPAVGRTGGGLARVEIAGSYTCRPRNNQKGAQVSEHGRGKAVDVSGLRLQNGSVITVAEGWKNREQGRILRQIHDAACGPFGTVLGPGSDGFHEDHIHVDTAERRSSAYCR